MNNSTTYRKLTNEEKIDLLNDLSLVGLKSENNYLEIAVNPQAKYISTFIYKCNKYYDAEGHYSDLWSNYSRSSKSPTYKIRELLKKLICCNMQTINPILAKYDNLCEIHKVFIEVQESTTYRKFTNKEKIDLLKDLDIACPKSKHGYMITVRPQDKCIGVYDECIGVYDDKERHHYDLWVEEGPRVQLPTSKIRKLFKKLICCNEKIDIILAKYDRMCDIEVPETKELIDNKIPEPKESTTYRKLTDKEKTCLLYDLEGLKSRDDNIMISSHPLNGFIMCSVSNLTKTWPSFWVNKGQPTSKLRDLFKKYCCDDKIDILDKYDKMCIVPEVIEVVPDVTLVPEVYVPEVTLVPEVYVPEAVPEIKESTNKKYRKITDDEKTQLLRDLDKESVKSVYCNIKICCYPINRFIEIHDSRFDSFEKHRNLWVEEGPPTFIIRELFTKLNVWKYRNREILYILDKYDEICIEVIEVQETKEVVEKPNNYIINAIPINNKNGLFKDVERGYIIKQYPSGSLTALSIEVDGSLRPLNKEEKRKARNTGLAIMESEITCLSCGSDKKTVRKLPNGLWVCIYCAECMFCKRKITRGGCWAWGFEKYPKCKDCKHLKTKPETKTNQNKHGKLSKDYIYKHLDNDKKKELIKLASKCCIDKINKIEYTNENKVVLFADDTKYSFIKYSFNYVDVFPLNRPVTVKLAYVVQHTVGFLLSVEINSIFMDEDIKSTISISEFEKHLKNRKIQQEDFMKSTIFNEPMGPEDCYKIDSSDWIEIADKLSVVVRLVEGVAKIEGEIMENTNPPLLGIYKLLRKLNYWNYVAKEYLEEKHQEFILRHQDDQTKAKCIYIPRRGRNKGKVCNKPVIESGKYCKICIKKRIVQDTIAKEAGKCIYWFRCGKICGNPTGEKYGLKKMNYCRDCVKIIIAKSKRSNKPKENIEISESLETGTKYKIIYKSIEHVFDTEDEFRGGKMVLKNIYGKDFKDNCLVITQTTVKGIDNLKQKSNKKTYFTGIYPLKGKMYVPDKK